VGEAITFYTEEDFVQLKSIANVMKQSGCKDIPEWVMTSLGKGRKDKKKERETKPIQRDDILQKPGTKPKSKKKKGKKGKKEITATSVEAEENVEENEE
jgi:ATP-dependent RNA helicase DDX52/ROK1